MFKVGDIVRIKNCPDAWPGSPANNLEGSIVEITEITPYKKYTPRYSFIFIENMQKMKQDVLIQIMF